jgi:hypothetical protein
MVEQRASLAILIPNFKDWDALVFAARMFDK